MTTDAPQTHIDEAQKLEAEGLVELYQLTLATGSVVYFKSGENVTWQGNTYEGIPFSFSGVKRHSTEKAVKPQLQLQNPAGIYSASAKDGVFDGAVLNRYRVLKDDVDNDVNTYDLNLWVVSRISSLSRKEITLELRGIMDGQLNKVPVRMFMPPEFPFVKF